MAGSDLVHGLVESGAAEWITILSLVFGGCCSNVYALEALLKQVPNAGTFLTFAQFVYVTFQTLSSQLVWPKKPIESSADSGTHTKSVWGLPRWRKRVVPLRRWIVQVVLFFAISLMNNYAFGLTIPVTVHIIFRSGGLCVSMLTGYLVGGKRYSPGQVLAGGLITVGIILATISAPQRRRTPSPAAAVTTAAEDGILSANLQYFAGIGLLAAALVLSAWLGLWQEQTYKRYGKQWREALFYSHFLSLPFFIPLYPTLSKTYSAFLLTSPVNLLSLPVAATGGRFGSFLALGEIGTLPHTGKPPSWWHRAAVPSAILALAVNVVTQGICVRGVNRLTSRVNSVTVNLVLTLRKAVSLAISVWFYGNGFSTGLAVGGAMVLLGTIVYSLAPGLRGITGKSADTSSGNQVASGGRSSSLQTRSSPDVRRRKAQALST